MTIMRKTLLLTTACCAGLALAVPSAQAQKEAGALVQPKSGWAVTKIDASTTQGGAYCTLARQFENGVIFSIGRNKAEEYSVAVDFQEAKLSTDNPYDITLKAGNQTRQMQMLPVSPRALVIRLGWDDSFFAAMEKSQTFSIAFDKKTYALSLPEYAKGKADLAKCMDTLKSANAGTGGTDVLAAESGIGGEGFAATKTAQAEGSTSVAPPAKKDPAKRPEKTSITELNTPEVTGLTSNDKAAYVAPTRSLDVSSLEQENEKLRRQLTEQRQSYEARMAQGNQGNKVAELEEKLRLAEQRGGASVVAPAAAVVPAPVAAPVPVPVIKEVIKPDPAQAQKIAELEKKIADLNKDIAAKAAMPAKVAPAVVAQPDPAQTKKITELEQKVASLSKELSSRNDLTMRAAPTPLPNPEQAKRITDLQEQVGTLRTQLAEAKKVPVPAPVPVVAAPVVSKPQDAARIAELEQARQTYETRIASLESQLSSLQQPAPVAEKKSLRPVPSATPTDSQSQGQIAALQGELQAKNAQVRSSQQRLASYERELSQLRQQVGQLQRGGAKPAAGEVPVERLKKENETLRAQLAQQKEQFERRLAAADQPHQQPQPQKMAQVTPVPRSPDVSASVAPVAVASGGSDLKNILSRAGITASAAASGNGAAESYSWKNGVMNGKAQAYAGKGNALDVSQQYANNQRNACTGDFASVPGPAKDGRVSMDIACVDNSGARAQSLLFAEEGGQVMAFIIESSAEEMDQAMDARDSLGKQL